MPAAAGRPWESWHQRSALQLQVLQVLLQALPVQ
jgi:hypothetical protein